MIAPELYVFIPGAAAILFGAGYIVGFKHSCSIAIKQLKETNDEIVGHAKRKIREIAEFKNLT